MNVIKFLVKTALFALFTLVGLKLFLSLIGVILFDVSFTEAFYSNVNISLSIVFTILLTIAYVTDEFELN